MDKNISIKSRDNPISRANHLPRHLCIPEVILILQTSPPEIKKKNEGTPSKKGKTGHPIFFRFLKGLNGLNPFDQLNCHLFLF